jgi:hypothetical protein
MHSHATAKDTLQQHVNAAFAGRIPGSGRPFLQTPPKIDVSEEHAAGMRPCGQGGRQMPSWVWILIALLVVAVVVTLAFVAARSRGSKQTERLRQHYGPEYDRAVTSTGDQRAAEEELVARERKLKKLDIVSLSPQAKEMYSEQWRLVQTGFVDNPASAVKDADLLVNQVMRERGYPIDDFEQRAADISVNHPAVVENYRAAHGIYLTQQNGQIGTEAQREAFVRYRALFEKLLGTDQDTPKEARA